MVVVGVRIHGEDLVLHPKGRLTPRFHFMSFRKSEAELTQARERAWRH
jgi:hypothetical protein